MPIACIAIVGPQNNPLYLRIFSAPNTEQDQKLNFIVHCSLDVVEEKVLLKRVPGELPDAYLGLLYPTEEFRAYGYISNTNTKFIAVVDDASLRDEAISKALRALHSLYVDALSNPFFSLPGKSKAFEAQIGQVTALLQ